MNIPSPLTGKSGRITGSRAQTLSVCAVLLTSVLAAGTSFAQLTEGEETGYEFVGLYSQFGFVVAQADESGENPDPSGGFVLAGGYRANSWLAADANFTFAGNSDATSFAFTFGPKFYPLGAFEVSAIPENVQPYGLIGIGGGETDDDDDKEGFFAARFIIGIDYWWNEHLGLFVEGGGLVPDGTDTDGIGVFTFGAQYRF